MSNSVLNNRKRRPTHPGEVLRDLLPDTGLTQVQFSNLLGVSPRTLSLVLQQKRAVTVDLAHRLSRALGTSTEVWLSMQQAVDVWDALQEHGAEYTHIHRLAKTRWQVSKAV